MEQSQHKKIQKLDFLKVFKKCFRSNTVQTEWPYVKAKAKYVYDVSQKPDSLENIVSGLEQVLQAF